MMSTYNATLDKIAMVDEGLQLWVSGPIHFTVATSLLDDSTQIINLNETIGTANMRIGYWKGMTATATGFNQYIQRMTPYPVRY